MILILPLGISLRQGVFLQVDEGDLNEIPIDRCEREGCFVELLLSPALVADLKAGNLLKVIMNYRDETLVIDISLQGFTAALAELSRQ